MTEITEKDIKDTIVAIDESFSKELFSKQESELEEYWFFKWDKDMSVEWNLYEFHDLLKLYGSSCRRWEEHHNGSCCVVERVRDKYLMPKIKGFVEIMRTAGRKI